MRNTPTLHVFTAMPYDPTLPAPNSPLESQVIRDQLQALFVLINNIVNLSAAQVDGVNSVPAGSPAQVAVSVYGTTLHFSFDLPQGQQGPMGQQGPPFATAMVDAVNTVEPDQPATVSVNYDGTNVRFTFDIPRGHDGMNGSNGSDGGQGPAGEISQTQLDTAISGTSANTNGITTLDSVFADADMEVMRQKLNEMILNGRR